MAQCFPISINTCVLYGQERAETCNLKKVDYTTEWDVPFYIFDNKPDYPTKVVSIWYSYFDNKFFFLSKKLNSDIFDQYKIEGIIAAFFPQGLMAIWARTNNATKLLLNYKAQDITDYMLELIYNERGIPVEYDNENTDSLEIDLFDNYLKQFTYRYVPLFEHWDNDDETWQKHSDEEIVPEFDYIEEALYDGTHDKLHDGGLLNYHEAGKPKKLAAKWHIKKSDYVAYLWFDDMKIRDAFEWFYTKYPDAKMDFIFHIDTENKVFQISFDCEEADEPMLLSEDTYQMIIFKSKFEYYRTPNYNQPRGAWIW